MPKTEWVAAAGVVGRIHLVPNHMGINHAMPTKCGRRLNAVVVWSVYDIRDTPRELPNDTNCPYCYGLPTP